jgi:predicted AlkP superfamily pyrophosphatase or phosphodiesterase
LLLRLKKLLLKIYYFELMIFNGFYKMQKLKKLIIVFYLALFYCEGLIGQGAYIPPDKPKLVIGIIVEQLRYDQIERFRSRFDQNGIRRLLNEGTNFQNASFQYMLTQSAPGHATIATGAEPAWHGITSDTWYLPLRNELIYCTKDLNVNPAGGTPEAGRHSPVNLQASTFADELKMSSRKKAKVFSVGLKDNSVILSAGHSADGAYWFDNTAGSWISSTWYVDSLPEWVNDFNAMRYPEAFLNSKWELLRPRQDYYDCVPDTNSYEAGFGGQNYFPYDLRKISSKVNASSVHDMSLISETPFGNTLTTSFAKKLIEMEKLGKDDITDYLSICYTSTDYIGHRFGPSSFEMADAIFRLDREIEDLMTYLVDSIGKMNILIYFTSSHGISEVPAVLENNGIPSGYFRQDQALYLVKSYLKALYGEGEWIKGYSERQIYLNRTLLEDSRIPLEDVQKKVARFIVQFSGIASAYPYSAFEVNDFGEGNLKKVINNFSPQRSGDIILTFYPGWVEKVNDYVTNNNSPYEYDSHVPLVWWGWSVDRAIISRKVNMTDIAPTLSALLKVPYPNACSGEPLFELFR